MANVIVHNKLSQTLRIGVKDDQGDTQEVVLFPFAKSAAIDEAKLTDYTKGLAAQGHVKIRTA